MLLTAFKAAIDEYMASCKRSPSSVGDDDVEKDDEDDEDGVQSKNEFDEFKKWLDGKTPSQAVPTKCNKCGSAPCR